MINYRQRRQRLFLILSGLFLGTLSLLNILGISRFVDLSFTFLGLEIPMNIAIGALPYPVTFICTDLMSELYGRKRTTEVVWMGLVLNLWIMFLLWLGGVLPGTDSPVFFEIRTLAFAAVTASMVAYLSAQYCDVRLFHFWKWLTNGKHLWLRNNGSTVVSQLVDSTAVILVTYFYANALPIVVGDPLWPQLFTFIASLWVFKIIVALLDTGPIYFLVAKLRPYLGLQWNEEVGSDDEDVSTIDVRSTDQSND